jgi:hypothetical protein
MYFGWEQPDIKMLLPNRSKSNGEINEKAVQTSLNNFIKNYIFSYYFSNLNRLVSP